MDNTGLNKIKVEVEYEGYEWAEGCGLCEYGLLSTPAPVNVGEHYMERLAYYKAGQLDFCGCKAGKMYEISLKNRLQKLIEEARKHPMMQRFAERGTHPDLASIQQAIAQHVDIKAPSIRWAGKDAVGKPEKEIA